MDPSQEPVIVVDDQDNEVAILPRLEAEADEAKNIRMVYILLIDDEGQILLQRRHGSLARFPNYWTVSASGAVYPKEGYVQAAERKLFDELGFTIPLFSAHKELLLVPKQASRMTNIFVGKVKDIAVVKHNTSKISELRWVSIEDAEKGYLLTPSCAKVLKWWGEHGADVRKDVEAKYA